MPDVGNTTSLIGREFLGKILPDKDSIKNQGRYKVHVADVMPHMKEEEGIWCKNHSFDNRISTSDSGMCGGYHPLQPGMKVIVRFFEESLQSGYIARIISDHEEDTLPFKGTDRDDLYLMMRTPKKDNVICINEETQDQPSNSIHIIYNKTRTHIIIDETGIHIKTDDSLDIDIRGNTNILTVGETNITSNGEMNLQASKINLNCGKKAIIPVPQTIKFEEAEKEESTT